jgi:hypothetical protein
MGRHGQLFNFLGGQPDGFAPLERCDRRSWAHAACDLDHKRQSAAPQAFVDAQIAPSACIASVARRIRARWHYSSGPSAGLFISWRSRRQHFQPRKRRVARAPSRPGRSHDFQRFSERPLCQRVYDHGPSHRCSWPVEQGGKALLDPRERALVRLLSSRVIVEEC